MRPGENRHDGGRGGGVPDGLLIGVIAFLLGITLLTWTAAGLAALLAHGAWPEGLSFTRTPLAMRHLVSAPRDLPAAWPDTPPGSLSGYGLFWGLLIGQLMILLVLAIFTMGTLARWKAVRARKRAGAYDTPPPPEPAPTATESLPVEATPSIPAPAAPPLAVERPIGAVRFAPPTDRRSPAVQAIQDAEGATLVVTSDPTLWQDTKDARAKLGPVHLYDPAHLCDTPSRLHWSPTTGCEDKQTAAARATALLTPVKPTARLDQAVNDTAETLLRSYLHAAALDNRTIRHVHRWCQGNGVQEAVRTLRTHPKAAPGSAGELEAALTAHPERRDIAHELTTRALSALSVVNLREACTPNRTDALALDSFVDEGGSLYVVGESIEDPRTHPGAMPLLTALVSSVVERGRRMAERSSSGRLDPPLTLVLDDIAAVAPLPQLPDLLASGADQGLPTLALLRSREQARSRWPHHDLPL
ncbi:type IV secretory system conjugative DNA transfer family protein [Streptomyces antibioticus]|uniref:type IV secretory system conjugative DNA transfer family protein n=1 Tax=Streptomyces antibioticus TaxID=1890 RepID=UPI0033E3733F